MTWPNVPTIIAPTPAHGSNLRGGVDPPLYFTSGYYQPDIGYYTGGLATTSIGGIFFEPFYVWRPQAFRGMSVVNTSTSENGKVAMLGLYNDDSSSGGPGTLAHTFGQITFGTISAVTTALNTANLNRGRYWMTAWFASQCGMYRLDIAAAAGSIGAMLTSPDIGAISPSSQRQQQGWYATTTYATTFPASAVTPITSLEARMDAGSTASAALAMWMFV